MQKKKVSAKGEKFTLTTVEAKARLDKKIDFKKLTKAQARVEIAKDVIAQLKLKKVKATAGTYIEIKAKVSSALGKRIKKEGEEVPLFGVRDEVERVLSMELREIPRQNCEACALGTMFLAEVDRNNHCKVDLSDREPYVFLSSRHELDPRLRRYFTEHQLNEIEDAFEGYRLFEAWAFAQSDEERMIAIMQNIIINQGNFKVDTFLDWERVEQVKAYTEEGP